MENQYKIQIIREPSDSKPYLIINKPSGLPSAPLNPQDTNNALYQAIEIYPELKQVKGKKEIEYGLLHRIDTPTSGLILIAANQDFYDYMQQQQKDDKFVKFYKATCFYNPDNPRQLSGFPEVSELNSKIENNTEFSINSYFRYYGKGNKEVRPVTKNGGKSALNKVGKLIKYKTDVAVININGKFVEVECRITRGFKHQVRCHLAWLGLPIIGDEIYNSEIVSGKKNAVNLMFTASKIQFYYPEGDLNSYEITPTST